MTSESEPKVRVTVNGGGGWLGFALLIICFVDEPDLVDALIHYLMTHTP